MSNKTHHENFDIFLQTLNENNVRFIFMRGYKYLPEKADTDLDTIIHPDDWDKYKSICSNLINDNLIGYEKHGILKHYGESFSRKMIYYPIFTKGTNGEHLPNKSFRIDSYSDLYFFEGNKGKILPLKLLNYLFTNRKQINNYFIPDDISNIILLICRNIYDKDGDWSASGTKHTSVIENLIMNVKENDFNNVSNIFFNINQQVYQKIKNRDYKSIKKPSKMLFLIRKNGLLRHTDIIKNTQTILIENNYCIEEEGLVTIKDKKDFLYKLYGDKINNKELQDSINNANTNMCYYFITDYYNYKQNSLEIKKKLRNLYPNPDNIHWNYFHSADNIDDAYNEIDILKSNKLEFIGLGTYYNQRNI